MTDLSIRFATVDDIALILTLIKELADYEQLLDQVVATEEVLYDSLFNNKSAEVIIGEVEGKPIGFALFFHNFSTFLGKSGIYLEDLYIRPEQRGKGYGKQMLAYLAKVAVNRNCERFEWWCLDWNQSSIDFYKRMGAEAMDEWTVYRVSNQQLKDLSDHYHD